MKSDLQSNNAMENNQQGRQSKSPFKAFLGTNYHSKYLNFFRRPAMVANIFQGLFQGLFARGHWISNFNPEIDHGHEIIIPFGVDSIGPMESYWCVMTTRSCSFDTSQCHKFRMGYDYEIEQQVHLLVKNPLDTSCQLLVT